MQNARAHLLYWITLSLIAVDVLALLVPILLEPVFISSSMAYAIIVVSFVVHAINLVLLHKRAISVAGVILLLLTWTAFVGVSVLTGGVYSPAFPGLVITALLASLVFGTRGGLVVSAANLGAGLWMIMGGHSDVYPPDTVAPPFAFLLDSAVFTLLAALIPNAAIRTIQMALQRAQESTARYHALNTELERRVIERTAELEEINSELESFAYSISHDLRAPLRAISGFSHILLAEHRPQLAPEAQRYLSLVHENAVQMSQLIKDLLAFARLGRQDLRKERVTPRELVREVVADLCEEYQDRHIEVSVGDLSPCLADPTLLKQVYANLLSNAFKFTRERQDAHIEVGCERQNGETVYYVRDNGVGFDMRYADKLFGAFQRLHGAQEYEGTGVGLAIVQRIIHRHGGRVWAEAAADQGATFSFTLERAHSQERVVDQDGC
jgi:signal transduction histidine kinase